MAVAPRLIPGRRSDCLRERAGLPGAGSRASHFRDDPLAECVSEHDCHYRPDQAHSGRDRAKRGAIDPTTHLLFIAHTGPIPQDYQDVDHLRISREAMGRLPNTPLAMAWDRSSQAHRQP